MSDTASQTSVPLELKAFGKMVRLAQAVSREAESAFTGKEVTSAQYQILSTLASEGTLKQNEIARALGVTTGNVSQLLSKLEGAGHIKRESEGTSKFVSLTTRGERLVEALGPNHAARIQERFSALSQDELDTLMELLGRLDETN